MATGKGPIGSFELISAQRGMSVKVVFHFIVCNLVVRLAVFVFVEETRFFSSRVFGGTAVKVAATPVVQRRECFKWSTRHVPEPRSMRVLRSVFHSQHCQHGHYSKRLSCRLWDIHKSGPIAFCLLFFFATQEVNWHPLPCDIVTTKVNPYGAEVSDVRAKRERKVAYRAVARFPKLLVCGTRSAARIGFWHFLGFTTAAFLSLAPKQMQCTRLQIGVAGNRSYRGAVFVFTDNQETTEHFEPCQVLAVAYFFNDWTFARVHCRETTAEQTAEAESELLPSYCNVLNVCGLTKPTGFSLLELAFKAYEILMSTTCFYAVGTRENHVVCHAVC